MKTEQRTAMRELGAKASASGPLWDTCFESAFYTHGHLCGGMPFASPFVQQRKQGVAPTAIPVEVSRPLVEKQLARPDEDLFVVSAVFDYPLPAKGKAGFNLVLCSVCGEAVAENRARVRDGQPVCIPCSGYGG